VQARLPILIGGSGPRKTLRTLARYGDAWNTSGTLDEVRGRLGVLDDHCLDIGRDRSEIELTVSFPILIRDDADQAAEAWQSLCRHNGIESAGATPHLLGSPAAVADAIRPYVELGFSTIIVRHPAPYDRETIERMPEVAERLAAAPVGGTG
jgi:alkanesulfonate monooxygenase SsuD/methylene tetrahydromethanopterin reductase-like flavin-dependent oxidoreductase (luciferase family)